jgi:Tol biopolymer transport system component
MQYSPTDRICFSSNRRPSAGGYDIYVYDPVQDTVLAVVGVNTPADETHPDCSNDGRWLVFQRGVKSGDGVQQDILLYNTASRMVNTLHGLNSSGANETQPSLGADGTLIVYVSDEGGYPGIRLYNIVTGDAFQVPGANRRAVSVSAPTLSGDGHRIAYVAANAADPGNTDILIYDIPTATQYTPPFINSLYREDCPDLSADGRRVLFTSDRFGNDDIFEADLETGFTDNMSFLNTDDDERFPRYMGGSVERVVFQLRTREETPRTVLRGFNRVSMQLDTLPVANALFADSALGSP